MKAYCLFDVREVLDSEKLDRYSRGVLETVEAHGGRYLHVGGSCEVVEGDWSPSFPVLIEFPGIDEARAWYRSPQYRALRTLRQAGAKCDAVILQPEVSDLRALLIDDRPPE